jgi:hypothetical protein
MTHVQYFIKYAEIPVPVLSANAGTANTNISDLINAFKTAFNLIYPRNSEAIESCHLTLYSVVGDTVRSYSHSSPISVLGHLGTDERFPLRVRRVTSTKLVRCSFLVL